MLFSFRHFGSVEWAQALQKSFVWPPVSRSIEAAGSSLNKMSIFVGIAASIAVAMSGNSGGSHDGRAYIGVGLHGRTHLIDFIDRQLASTCAREYSVVFLSRHTFSPFRFLLHPLACPHPRFKDTQCLRQSRLWAGA